MGFNEQPEIASYWSKSKVLGCEAISNVFTRERFMFIWANLTYSEHTSYTRLGERFTFAKDDQSKFEKDEDPACRVRMMADIVNRRFRAVRNPGRSLCVDEMMTAYKGRVGNLIAHPDKPIRKGYEHYAVCEAGTGYVLNDEPNLGKKIKLLFPDGEPLPL